MERNKNERAVFCVAETATDEEPPVQVDWSLIGSETDAMWTPERESLRSVSDRSHAFLLWLRDRPEREVVPHTRCRRPAQKELF